MDEDERFIHERKRFHGETIIARGGGEELNSIIYRAARKVEKKIRRMIMGALW